MRTVSYENMTGVTHTSHHKGFNEFMSEGRFRGTTVTVNSLIVGSPKITG